MRHPKWDERPLLMAVLKPGETAAKEDIVCFLRGQTARWWVPDDVVFVDEIPHTATGKTQKAVLCERYRDYTLPGTAA